MNPWTPSLCDDGRAVFMYLANMLEEARRDGEPMDVDQNIALEQACREVAWGFRRAGE